MTQFTSKFAAIACTIVLSATCVVAAVGPAQAVSGATPAIVQVA